ncbi:hypothetical protein SAMN05421770_107188 [Granulicella rosea]|uniref:VOC domain-containing protein n=1 Tax=Granulicella rosea TaxID=474952 RepID=A0A239LR78_9BACT|nr:VOC family protein [Granulicella rosea]SNT32412.1 hypothetical protein SAMN05421770_107188 [Granulicella rosea]
MDKQRRELLTALTAAAGSALLPGSLSAAGQAPAADASARETVTGIGGFFYRAHDPKALEAWYHEHLGIAMTPRKKGDPVWRQQAGVTSFSAFSEKNDYFDVAKPWMINFRVANLERLAAQLTAAGIEVKLDPAAYPGIGRFAHLHDPEGNPIELWQPE